MGSTRHCLTIYPPMLDIFCHRSAETLRQDGLKVNTITAYCSDKHRKIDQEMQAKIAQKDAGISFKAGGATFNTQKLLSRWMPCEFFGIVGNDLYGQIIEEEMAKNKENIDIHLDRLSNAPTPWAYVFLSGDERTLISKQDFNMGYSAQATEEMLALVDWSTVFYIVAFSFPLKNIARQVFDILELKKEKRFVSVINLSAEEIAGNWKEAILRAMKDCDFVIGNIHEYYQLCETASRPEILSWLDAQNIGYAITDGPGEVIGRIPGGPLQRASPRKLHHDANTNGAGDSFVAGFIKAMDQTSWSTTRDIQPLLDQGVQVAYDFISHQPAS